MIVWNSLDDSEKLTALARPAMQNSEAVRGSVSAIIETVASNGDIALYDYTRQFDGVTLSSLKLDSETLHRLADSVDERVKAAIRNAMANITAFHEAQKPETTVLTTQPGVVCEQRFAAIESVGLYIPGGSAPLPSTVMMLGIPARVAGCDNRFLCTPPNKQGEIAPEIAFTALACGIDAVYLCGGAQAIAAMALGTDTIPRADKIFGPGNSFVTEAKQQVSQLQGGPAIDMPAGPSEVLVIADANANAEFVAADLLSQAEHGADSQAILVTESRQLIEATMRAVEEQIAKLSRNDIAQRAMKNARYILTDSVEQSVQVSNQYAPEHLIVQTGNADKLMAQIRNAGSVFLGPWSPESAGDYASGTNHVLPTYGYARNYSSLGLSDFMRRYTVQTLSADGLRSLGPAIMTLAEAEGLDAHRQAVAIRLATLDKEERQ